MSTQICNDLDAALTENVTCGGFPAVLEDLGPVTIDNQN
jgi:hypothetical protein